MNMATHAKTRRNILNFDISYKIISPVGGEQSLEAQLAVVLREVVKYYFADFVRKGGTPPPLRTKFLPKKKLRIWGVPPPPPLRTFPRKMFFKKC